MKYLVTTLDGHSAKEGVRNKECEEKVWKKEC